MRSIAAVCIGIALLCTPGRGARAQGVLPEAPEKDLVQEHCAQCHKDGRIEESEGSEAEWTIRIRRMMRRGSNLPVDRIAPLAAYLARALPPRVRQEAVVASPVQTTVSEVARRSLQVWIRAAGTLQPAGNAVRASLSRADADLIEVGQRARAFPLQAKSSMQQGRVVAVDAQRDAPSALIELRSRSSAGGPDYLLEIVSERGPFLCVPNEAIIEENGRRVAYVQLASGDFAPREIATGIQGELYTQVLSGVEEGERVVTFGSFFIDAEYKMKGAP